MSHSNDGGPGPREPVLGAETGDFERVDRELLYRLPLFSGVAPKHIDFVCRSSSLRTLRTDELLLTPEEENSYVFLVLAGRLQVHVGDPMQIPVAVVEAGECVGEMSVIDSKRPSAYVVAAEPTRLLRIHRDTIWRLIDASRGLAPNLLHMLSKRLRANNDALYESMRQQLMYERFAHLDPLTNLHNRRWLDRTLYRLLAVNPGGEPPLSLIFLDVDHFKRYNDKFGHLGGDQALRRAAAAIHESLRPDDMAARYGGEEFAVLLPRTDLNGAMSIAERLRRVIRELPIASADGEPLSSITVSLGVTQLVPGQNAKQFLAAADSALYRAKQAGRDRVSV
jgi:diguanylate cyclase (GGDEF)-like protein